MPNAFVTGGTGFVGSHLVERLLSRGYEVTCLVRSEAKWLEGLPVTFVRGSLDDPSSVAASVARADEIHHVAGLTKSRSWDEYRAANVDATVRLVEAAAARTTPPRMVVTSSLAAVGRSDTPVADESTPLRPISLYGRSKAEMERALVPWFDRLPLTVVRPPAVYGPRETDILTFFRSVARGVCPVVGRGDVPALSLVHVSDLVEGMADAAVNPNAVSRTYFLGGERQYTWHEIRDAAAAALGRRVLTLPIPPALVQPLGAVTEFAAGLFGRYPPLNREKAREIRFTCTMCSSAAAGRDLAYRPSTPLEQGVADTIAWYRSRGWI